MIPQKNFPARKRENKLLLAKSLFAYYQGIRFLEDVQKIARRFINMGKYIEGKKYRNWYNVFL